MGSGCAGSAIIYRLSTKYHVNAYEAGLYRLDDGATYNLAVAAPVAHLPTNLVSSQKPAFTEPPVATQWAGLTFLPQWNVTTVPIYPSFIPPALQQTWSQGKMFGGSMEHIQGVRVNPSKNMCNRWAAILKDDRFLFENFVHVVMETEHFRMSTNPTVQTWDGTTFSPFDGPSILGSRPINRGYNGFIQCTQASPSAFSTSLATAMYDYHRNVLGYNKFTIQPVVGTNCESTTFNSGIDACVTRCPERYIDVHRNRVSTARNYLNPSVIESVTLSVPSGNPGYTINYGPYKGINGHDIDLQFDKLIQRIVFKTRNGYPSGQQYWIQQYSTQQINLNAFRRPLQAIGIEYGPSPTNKVFVPLKRVVCSLGTLATPALLMQSGIGPRSTLENLGIPVLYNQEEMGRNISNHYGTIIRWTGNVAIWGNTAIGTENSNGYLPIASNPTRRKYQYYSSASPPLAPTSWVLNLYDLNPKSTGWLDVKQSWDTTGGLIDVAIVANYYELQEDIDNLCEIVRTVAAAIIAKDPTVIFTAPALPYPFNVSNSVLFTALMQNFTQQTHFVGSCGMGPDGETNCVDTNFKLRGTKNVFVCDASSTPLETDDYGNVYPMQNDGNTIGGVLPFAEVFAKQFL